MLDDWELNQFPVERVEDLPFRLTGIAGWMPGKWPECRRRMLRGEPALPLAECVNPLFLELINADREYTRARFEKAIFAEPHEAFRDEAGNPEPVGARGRVQILGEEGRDPYTEIEDGGLDVVWLSGEIGYTPLLQEVPRWRRKFPVVRASRPEVAAGQHGEDVPAGGGGLVCGGFHDIENWPESTACVEMLLGTPEVVTAEGEWLKRVFSFQSSVFSGELRGAVRFPLAIPLEEPERVAVGQADVGIVFYQNDRGEGTVEGLMMSLHALRKYWDGEVTVLFSGEESPSVRIACARYAALYREVPEPEVDGDPRVVRPVFIDPEAQVREWSPYTRTLWMEAGLTGQEREIQKFLRRADSGKSKPTARTVTPLRRDPAREARQTEARAALEVEVMLAWAATARGRHGATVVQALLPEDLPGFERNWTATRWRHAAMTLDEEPYLREPVPVLLVLCDGVTPEDATHAMRHRAAWSAPEPDSPPPPTVRLTREHVPPEREESAPDEPHWTHALATAAAAADTEWLLYVDPMMHPSPGAELFLPHRLPDWGAEEQPFAVYAPGWAFRRIGGEEEAWARRVYGSPVRASTAPAAGQGEVSPFPDDLCAGQILKHLRLGPSATMIRRDLMLAAYAEWGTHFPEIPFEIFLTLRLRRDGTGYGICRPQDWGWNL